MYGYIYKTTNKISGKIYVGQKKSDIFLDEKYLGSGVAIKDAIKSYGKENFTVQMLDEADSQEELDKKEVFWIDKLDSRNGAIGYNIAFGGNCFTSGMSWFTNGEIQIMGLECPEGFRRGKLPNTQESNYKNSLAHIGYKNAKPTLGKHHYNNGVKEIFLSDKDVIPDGFKMGRLSRYKGNKWYNNGMVQVHCNTCPDGFVPGMLKRVNKNEQLS